MLARIDAILRRAEGNRASLRSFGALHINSEARTVEVDGAPVPLTPREWAILERLSRRPELVVSRQELEEALYGFGDEVESNAIEAHVSRLRAKLGRPSIETVRGFGYRMGRA
jgi:DNA-binding response OmpR family regulator